MCVKVISFCQFSIAELVPLWGPLGRRGRFRSTDRREKSHQNADTTDISTFLLDFTYPCESTDFSTCLLDHSIYPLRMDNTPPDIEYLGGLGIAHGATSRQPTAREQSFDEDDAVLLLEETKALSVSVMAVGNFASSMKARSFDGSKDDIVHLSKKRRLMTADESSQPAKKIMEVHPAEFDLLRTSRP